MKGSRRPGASRGRAGAAAARGRQALFQPGPEGQEAETVRYGLLLLAIVTAYLLSAFISSNWVSVVQVVLFVTIAGLAIRTGHIRRGRARAFIAVIIAGSVVTFTLSQVIAGGVAGAIALLWTGLVLLVSVILIVRRVLEARTVTLQSIFGAVSAYMIIGLMFAACYAAISKLSGGHFFVAGQDNVTTFQYFSFTTLTTLGYGDYTAAGSGGQAIAVMEALLGQVFLATLVARLVAAFRPGSRQTRRGSSRGGSRQARRRPPPPGRAKPARSGKRGPGAAATRISPHGRARPGRR